MLVRQRMISKTILLEWIRNMDPKHQQKLENITLSSGAELLTIEEEAKIKAYLGVFFGEYEIKLLNKLRADCNGLRGEKPCDGCPSKILISFGLARFDNGRGEKLLKATKFAFYEEVLYLLGVIRRF